MFIHVIGKALILYRCVPMLFELSTGRDKLGRETEKRNIQTCSSVYAYCYCAIYYVCGGMGRSIVDYLY